MRQLLDSLVPELSGAHVEVIVADNDCGDQVPALVDEFSAHLRTIRSVAVPVRGITAARNALVDAAFDSAPDWDWLIMLDDDGVVQPGWYATLLDVARRTGADVTGATVIFPLPPQAGLLARNSAFALPSRWPTGIVPALQGGQNICIARQVEAIVARPWFNPAYGLTGGEDHEFFARIRRAGGRFAWADDAVVSEPQPLERLSGRSILYRSLTTGITTARTDRQIDGALASLAATARCVGMSIGATLVYALTLRKDDTARAIIAVAYAVGRIPGVSRLVDSRYSEVTGS